VCLGREECLIAFWTTAVTEECLFYIGTTPGTTIFWSDVIITQTKEFLKRHHDVVFLSELNLLCMVVSWLLVIVWSGQIIKPASFRLVCTAVWMGIVVVFVLCADITTGFSIGTVYFVEPKDPTSKIIVISAVENHCPILYFIGMSERIGHRLFSVSPWLDGILRV
jgi:hypothetical protein